MLAQTNTHLKSAGLPSLKLDYRDQRTTVPIPKSPERLVRAYGEELVALGKDEPNLVVLDADLMVDCGLLPFRNKFPDRFVECGIAEQDMVSVAGGLALRGKLPVVHSFACFLSTRPNEQIYNNATEKRRIIYTGSLAGLLPAGPGHSHQSVRDISCLGAIPGLTIIQPSNEQETKLALRWAVQKNDLSTYIRLVSIPLELNFCLPPGYRLEYGQGVKLTTAKKKSTLAIVAYGPTMLCEAVSAGKELGVDVFNLPWLNFIDGQWLKETMGKYKTIVVIDDHYIQFGLGTRVAAGIVKGCLPIKLVQMGLADFPECGQNREILEYHDLTARSIKHLVKELLL